MEFRPRCTASAVGSMPHQDAATAVDLVLATIPEAPIWPQLSCRGLNEQMEVQFSESMPCRVIDREMNRMYFDTSGDYSEAFAEFYEAYLAAMDPDHGTGDCSAMAISPDYAAGIYALEERLKLEAGSRPVVKCQATGPCTFALATVDQNKRALYYNEEFRDVIVKALAMKCRWQIQKLKPYAEHVICSVDEPVLAGFGSSTYVSVQRDDVVAMLVEVIEAIHADGAIASVHCCANTEWSILMDAGADVVSFDAFEFGETIAMYPDHVRRHLQEGKAIAWGVVPTSTVVCEQTIETLTTHYEKLVDHLVEKADVDRGLVREQTLITGSCGTGSMEVADAERVFELSGALSAALRARYGF